MSKGFMLLFDKLDSLTDQAIQAEVEDVAAPYMLTDEIAGDWVLAVRDTLEEVARQGKRDHRIVFVNYSSVTTNDLAFALNEDREDCQYINGKWIWERKVCPKGFYCWYLRYHYGIERVIKPAQIILLERLKTMSTGIIQSLVDEWNSRDTGGVDAKFDPWSGTASISFSWHKKRPKI